MSFITNLNQQQRKRLHQITLVATFGGLLFGYDTGVINGAFSSLKQYMALTPTTEGLVMSVLLVGAALGSVFGGKFADYFGRRKYLLFLSFVFLIGALLSAAAPDITTLLIARALLGYAVGGVCHQRDHWHHLGPSAGRLALYAAGTSDSGHLPVRWHVARAGKPALADQQKSS